MARYLIKKKFFNIDTTALCDVAFILVCFFLLTGVPKPDYQNRVRTPSISSYPVCSISEGNALAIIVGGGKCFIDMDSELRKATLLKFGQKHRINFTKDEVEKFGAMRSFGVPAQQLKVYINNNLTSAVSNQHTPGIPFDDSAANELLSWIDACRSANDELNAGKLNINIIGDERESYTNIQTVINNLRRRDINKFSLINSARPLTAAL